jgi:intracellular multiplication protein IcmK
VVYFNLEKYMNNFGAVLNKYLNSSLFLSLGLFLSGMVFAADAATSSQETVNQLQNKVNVALNNKIDNKDQDATPYDSVNAKAFAGVPDGLMPLSSDQIKEIRRKFNKVQQAGSWVQDVPAKPVSSTVIVDLASGATPPVVRLSSGFVSSLVFLDSTGSPWPIKAYDLGDPKSFNIQWSQNESADPKDSINNTLLIQAITMYKVANLAVMLKGLNTPIMLTLVPGQEVVDYRVDLRCPGIGPNAKSSVSNIPAAASSLLVDVINGISPGGRGKKLKVLGGDAEAWILNKRMFLRTKMNIVSPSWVSTMSGSEGGMNAYELQPSSVVLALNNGEMTQIKIEGF